MDGVNELVERLAREAGFVQGNKPEQLLWSHRFGGWLEIRELHRFAAVVAEECAREADEEEQIRSKAGKEHPEESESRSRCFAGACAAANVGRCIRAKFKVTPVSDGQNEWQALAAVHAKAAAAGVSYAMHFSEAEGGWWFSVHSAAPSEKFVGKNRGSLASAAEDVIAHLERITMK